MPCKRLLLLMFVALPWAWSAPAHADHESDARQLICLDPAVQESVVGAASRLGVRRSTAAGQLIVGQRHLDVVQWARQYPKEFNRVCSAFAESRARLNGASESKDDASQLAELAGWAVPTILGALLTYIATTFQERRMQRKDLVASLRGDADRLKTEGMGLIEAYRQDPRGGVPPMAAFTTARSRLNSTWTRARARFRGQPATAGAATAIPPTWETAYQAAWGSDDPDVWDGLEQQLVAMQFNSERLIAQIDRPFAGLRRATAGRKQTTIYSTS